MGKYGPWTSDNPQRDEYYPEARTVEGKLVISRRPGRPPRRPPLYTESATPKFIHGVSTVVIETSPNSDLLTMFDIYGGKLEEYVGPSVGYVFSGSVSHGLYAKVLIERPYRGPLMVTTLQFASPVTIKIYKGKGISIEGGTESAPSRP